MTIQIRISENVSAVSGAKRNLKIVDKNSLEFQGLWNRFLDDYPLYTYRHALRCLDYFMNVSMGALVDRSFVCVGKDNKPVAICPLFILTREKGDKISTIGSERYAPAPLTYPSFSEKQRRAAEDVVYQEALSRLAMEDVNKWFVEADILSVGTELIEDQVFARSGALDVSIHQHIVDLSGDEKSIKRQLRRRAHTEINNGLKVYEFKIYDQNNYQDQIGERHALLHHKASGRVTRPLNTFNQMCDWIKGGNGFIIEQLHEDQTVNMTVVLTAKKTAIGGSTADDPDFNPKVPLMHSMMWKMFMECKKRGVKYVEIGETNFRDTLHQIMTQKEKNVAYFKRGFGEHSWPLKRWIWFRDTADELCYFRHQIELYEQHVKNRTE